MVTVGGQSRPSGNVLVTSSGEAVATAAIQSGSSTPRGLSRTVVEASERSNIRKLKQALPGSNRFQRSFIEQRIQQIKQNRKPKQPTELERQRQQSLPAGQREAKQPSQATRLERRRRQSLVKRRSRERTPEDFDFSGQVEQFDVEGDKQRKEATEFFVKGQKVGEVRGGKFRPKGAVARGEARARLEFEGEEETRQLEISRGELRERDIQRRQESAGQLLFGGGQSETTGVVRPVERPQGLQGLLSDVQKQQARFETQRARGEFQDQPIKSQLTAFGSLGLGAAASGIGTFVALTNPVKTAVGTFKFSKQFATESAFRKRELNKIGTSFKQRPAFATGVVAGSALLSKGVSKGFTKVSDVVRTKGLKEIPTEKVVAPEFFRGQTFPKIRKGQSAGELLKEFQRPGAGFTAAPKPFAKRTVAQRGTSEFPGVFQAPKVSPRFLRVSAEKKTGFSLNPFGTLRPTVTRIKPEGFKLLTGIRKGQRQQVPLKEAQKRFTKEPLGKSIIPFVKTEKEAVISAGTLLRQTGRKSFFRFEGRRIPIEEFETAKGGSKLTGNVVSARDVEKISSSSRLKPPARVTSADISASLFPRQKTSSQARASSSGSLNLKKINNQFVSSISRTAPTPSSKATSVPSSRTRTAPTPSSKATSVPSSRRSLLSRLEVPPQILKPTVLVRRKPSRQLTPSPQSFPVFARIRGRFRIVGRGRTPLEAVDIGRDVVKRTRATAFTVPSFGGQRLRGFRTKQEKRGTVFIEPKINGVKDIERSIKNVIKSRRIKIPV